MMTEGIEYGPGWTKKGESSGKNFGSPVPAIFDFDPLTLPTIGHDWCAQIQQAQTTLLKKYATAYSWPMHFPMGYYEWDSKLQTTGAVESTWTFLPTTSGCSVILPDGRCDLIVKFTVKSDGSIYNTVPIITGPATKPYKVTYQKGEAWAGLRLQSNMAIELWKTRLAQSRDNVLRDRKGVGQLNTNFGQFPVQLKCLTDVKQLLSQLQPVIIENASNNIVKQALTFIRIAGGRTSTADLAVSVKLSERQLNRLFLAHVGLPPKTYASIIQFHRALRLLKDHGLKSSEVAYEAGYSDQSHMIRRFQRFGGFSPVAIPRDINLPGFSAI